MKRRGLVLSALALGAAVTAGAAAGPAGSISPSPPAAPAASIIRSAAAWRTCCRSTCPACRPPPASPAARSTISSSSARSRARSRWSMVDAALDALKGEDKFKGNPVEVRTLMVLYPNRMHVVSIEGTGIEKMADLKGKRVSTGSPGSATEVMAFRVIEAAVSTRTRTCGASGSASPNPSTRSRIARSTRSSGSAGCRLPRCTDLGATPGVKIKLVDHAEVVDTMNAKYGNLYTTGVIPAKTYPGQDKDNRDHHRAEHPGRQCQDAGPGRLRHRQDLHREARRARRRAWRSQGASRSRTRC